MDSPKHTNRLIKEKSPYLLQHAHNPVNWQPWCPEVFEEAKQKDKPVFLSIGYAACHWCHVMERESFEDEETALILNENFLAVKVDREERPDIDQIYMNALHSMGEQGGWPLNIFLSPDKLPIIGGTYFPPQPLYGRPSFRQVLQSVARAWLKEKQKVLESAQTVYDFIKNKETEKQSRSLSVEQEVKPLRISWQWIEQAAAQMKESYDPHRGGFLGNGPNKFPPSMQVLLLTALYRSNRNHELLEMAEHTLEQMKRGGIYDQIGGGLSRYSTDHNWLVPHFEKMLYDNALFIWALTETYRITKKEVYQKWALDIISYVKNNMTSPEGLFYCAEDADSQGEEGKFYVWSFDEFHETLKDAGFSLEERKVLADFWGLSTQGNFEGNNILHEALNRGQFLKTVNYSAEEWENILLQARKALAAQRSKRVRPGLDDKSLTAWNAYMITALAQASRAFALPELAEDAKKAADFIWEKLWDSKGNLLRRYCKGEARFTAGLNDYAALGCSFLDLYRVFFDTKYMERAVLISKSIREKFSITTEENKGAFYDTHQDNRDIIVRLADAYDSVEPSGNALAGRLFYTLSRYGIDEKDNQHQWENILEYFSSSLQEIGSAHSFLLYLCCHFLSDPVEAVVVDAKKEQNPKQNIEESIEQNPKKSIEHKKEITQVLNWLNQNLGGEGITVFASGKNIDAASKIIPLLAHHKSSGKEKINIYLCQNRSCQKPVHSLSELESLWETVTFSKQAADSGEVFVS